MMKLISPESLKKKYPVSNNVKSLIKSGIDSICDVLEGKRERVLIIVGPCSIHDPSSALEYAERLYNLSRRVSDRFILIMRAYFEKPRTALGWEGFISDPRLDESFDINLGYTEARKLILGILNKGVLVGTEFLDPLTPIYIGDLISWAALGARTVESPIHRRFFSGLNMPVGIKNTVSGGISTAVNAIEYIRTKHTFQGVDSFGKLGIIKTKGNKYAHLVLRGGDKPNYSRKNIVKSSLLLSSKKLKGTCRI